MMRKAGQQADPRGISAAVRIWSSPPSSRPPTSALHCAGHHPDGPGDSTPAPVGGAGTHSARASGPESCIALDNAPAAKREIACTCSFGWPVTALASLVEAVSEFAGRAAEKLRQQDGRAGQILAFIQTCPFRANDKQYSRSITMQMRRPTADAGLLTQSAIAGLKTIYRSGYNYAKARVMLLDLQAGNVEECELDLDEVEPDRSELMTVMDRINMRYGRGTLKLASAGIAANANSAPTPAGTVAPKGQRWQMKQVNRPRLHDRLGRTTAGPGLADRLGGQGCVTMC